LQRVETATRPTTKIDSATLTVGRLQLAQSVAPRDSTTVSDAASEPKLAPVIPEHSVALGHAPMMLAATIPSDASRMDAVETLVARDIAPEDSSSVARANVEASTKQESARIDMRPEVSTVDLSQESDVSAVALTSDQYESTPPAPAYVDSRLPVEAAPSVEALLVRAVNPHESARMDEVAETQISVPSAEVSPALERVEVARNVLVPKTKNASTVNLVTEESTSLLDESEASRSNLAVDTSDANPPEKVLIPEASAMLVSAPSLTLADDLATPQVTRIDNNQVEKLAIEVEALPGEPVRSSPSTDLARIAEDPLVAEEMAVAPGEIPSEHLLESVTVADADAADQLVVASPNVTPRDNMIPPPMLAFAAMALPAIDPTEHQADEAVVQRVDLSEALPERLHPDTPASLELPVPMADPELYVEAVPPSLAWEDRPARLAEEARPQELSGLPAQPAIMDSLRLPMARVATPELNIETLAEEIEPQLQSDDPWRDEIIGMLRGKVTEASTGRPLAGAEVRLTLPYIGAIVVVADGRGRYTMNVPDVPEFFAVSATLDGYVPETRSVSRDRVEGRKLRVDFELSPQDRSTLVMEAIPDVHHLGDNRFEGRINSQFQNESEGDRYSATFTLDSGQLSPGLSEGEVVLLAKGVQRSHRIVINGETLNDRLDDAPSDGSFGEFVAWFDVSILREGENTLEIIAKPSRSDIDDFEFVNVRVRLIR